MFAICGDMRKVRQTVAQAAASKMSAQTENSFNAYDTAGFKFFFF